jgi:hypothetical protein
MPDLSGFYTPEQEWGGLYKAADTLERNRYRDEQNEQRKLAGKTTNAKFITDYLDPKEHLSGSPYDPQVVGGFSSLLQEGMALVNDGADANMIMMALAPKVGKLSQYAQKAKLLTKQKEQALGIIKDNPAIDKNKFIESFNNEAYYTIGEDGQRKMKDISEIDVDADYGTKAIENGDVFTSAGFDEFYKSQVKDNSVTESTSITRYKPTGGMSKDKVKITKAGYFVPDEEEVVGSDGTKTKVNKGFVPEYEIANDEGNVIFNKVTDPDDKEKDEPVRVLSERVFKTLKPEQLGYLRQEVRKLLGEYEKITGIKVPLGSPQATMLARAIAYEELNQPTRRGWKIENEDIIGRPSAPEVRNYITGSYYPPRSSGSGSGSAEQSVNDVYSVIKEMSKDSASKGAPHQQVNLLPADAQNVVIDFARKMTGENDLGQQDIKIIYDKDGNVGVYWAKGSKNGRLISFLTEQSVNIKVQPGIGERRAVINKGGTKPNAPKKSVADLMREAANKK